MIPINKIKFPGAKSDSDILLFPKPLPVKLLDSSGNYSACLEGGDEILGVIARNQAKLDKIKIRSVANSETSEKTVLSKLVIGNDPNTWVAILKNSAFFFWKWRVRCSRPVV